VSTVEEAAYLAAMLCPRYGRPFIYDMASAIPVELRSHRLLGTAPAQRGLKAFERLVLNRASHIVCSMGLGDYVRSVAPGASFTEWRFPSVTSSPDERTVQRLRSDLNISPGSHVVVYSGNFAQYQGMDLLFEAFSRALSVDPALMLVCVGASEDARDGVLSRLGQHVRSRVRILTRRPRSSMPQFFAMADCLISLRPVSNNLPLKVFDYMAAGKPIVATKGPAHEPVLNHERAFMCDARTDSVTQAILEVFRSQPRAEEVARSAQWHALHHYGWGRFVQLVDSLYVTVAGPPGEAHAARRQTAH
jgi:glycosyltransferase involved in cell wall biosynthesis